MRHIRNSGWGAAHLQSALCSLTVHYGTDGPSSGHGNQRCPWSISLRTTMPTSMLTSMVVG